MTMYIFNVTREEANAFKLAHETNFTSEYVEASGELCVMLGGTVAEQAAACADLLEALRSSISHERDWLSEMRKAPFETEREPERTTPEPHLDSPSEPAPAQPPSEPSIVKIARGKLPKRTKLLEELREIVPQLQSTYKLDRQDSDKLVFLWAAVEAHFEHLLNENDKAHDRIEELEADVKSADEIIQNKMVALRIAYQKHEKLSDQLIKLTDKIASRSNSLAIEDEDDDEPAPRSRKKKENKHKLTAQRKLVDSFDGLAVRSELDELCDKKPGFTDWIRMENEAALQGFILKADRSKQTPRVAYDRKQAVRALIRYGFIGSDD